MTAQSEPGNERLLTPKQVAEILQVTTGTLETWRYQKKGPAWMKFGSSRRSPIRYKQADVDEFIEESKA